MTCHFTSFLTVFQSYQDDVRMIMKGCVKWNPIYSKKTVPTAGLRLRTARLTKLPGLLLLSHFGKLTSWSAHVSYNIEIGLARPEI